MQWLIRPNPPDEIWRSASPMTEIADWEVIFGLVGKDEVLLARRGGEYWVVAERQGQTAGLNMLGYRERHVDVPFFWSRHYHVRINYVGHAERWDEVEIDGDVAARDCLLRLKRGGRTLAVATIHCDFESLKTEAAMEQAAAA